MIVITTASTPSLNASRRRRLTSHRLPRMLSREDAFTSRRGVLEAYATANCRDDVHPRLIRNGRVEFRALLVHIHVNVATERRSRLAQAISQPWPFAFELVDELADRV